MLYDSHKLWVRVLSHKYTLKAATITTSKLKATFLYFKGIKSFKTRLSIPYQ